MNRPRRLVVCFGTATEVGKTWVGGQVLAGLRRRGWRVAARKPAQSFDVEEPGPSDAEVLATATGEDPRTVCAAERSYEVPMAPPMAAAALDRPVPTLDELVTAASGWPPGVDLGWVETVGGPRSPVAGDGDGVDLAAALAPDLTVLVADAGLGTVNAVRLSLAVLDRWPVVVLLNRYDPGDDLHRRNRAWLETHEGLGPLVETEALVDVLVSRFR
ncbi:MAG: dethiobiotin synthase [Actinobacteria bacterium]|nr:dethiobiotin synthase [Actinomycetota bacterium]